MEYEVSCWYIVITGNESPKRRARDHASAEMPAIECKGAMGTDSGLYCEIWRYNGLQV